MYNRNHTRSIANAVFDRKHLVDAFLRLEVNLGYRFINPYYLIDAIGVNPQIKGESAPYKRLAFVGDRIINFAHFCFVNGPLKQRYGATYTYLKAPQNHMLYELSKIIGLEALILKWNEILYYRNVNIYKHMIADVLEAMINAIAKDSGNMNVAYSVYCSLVQRYLIEGNRNTQYLENSFNSDLLFTTQRKLFFWDWNSIKKALFSPIDKDVVMTESKYEVLDFINDEIKYKFKNPSYISYLYLALNNFELDLNLLYLGDLLIKGAIADYLSRYLDSSITVIHDNCRNIYAEPRDLNKYTAFINSERFLSILNFGPMNGGETLVRLIGLIALDSDPVRAKELILEGLKSVLEYEVERTNLPSKRFDAPKMEVVEQKDNDERNILDSQTVVNNYSPTFFPSKPLPDASKLILESLDEQLREIEVAQESSTICSTSVSAQNQPGRSRYSYEASNDLDADLNFILENQQDNEDIEKAFMLARSGTLDEFIDFTTNNCSLLNKVRNTDLSKDILLTYLLKLLGRTTIHLWDLIESKIKHLMSLGSSLHDFNGMNVSALEILNQHVYSVIRRDNIIEYHNSEASRGDSIRVTNDNKGLKVR